MKSIEGGGRGVLFKWIQGGTEYCLNRIEHKWSERFIMQVMMDVLIVYLVRRRGDPICLM